MVVAGCMFASKFYSLVASGKEDPDDKSFKRRWGDWSSSPVWPRTLKTVERYEELSLIGVGSKKEDNESGQIIATSRVFSPQKVV